MTGHTHAQGLTDQPAAPSPRQVGERGGLPHGAGPARYDKVALCRRRGVHRSRRLRILSVLAVLAIAVPLWACQVPVFRYALERWHPDRYRVTVLHDASFDESQSEALAALRTLAEEQPGRPPAIDLQVVDLRHDGAADALNPAVQRSWQDRSAAAKPLVVVNYPAANRIGRGAPFCDVPLTPSGVAGLTDSPVRRELTDRLQRGDSAVWIFVPCGRESDDRAARARLETQLVADAKWLELPSPEELEVPAEILEQVRVPLEIRFSTLTLERDDPAEQFLLQALLHSESDLLEFDQPLAFPVFGRGRVLYALVGQGIAADTVRAASAFIAGPCSCQVKNQNPGFDLLLQSDWDGALGEVYISEPIESLDSEALAPKLLTIPPGRNNRD